MYFLKKDKQIVFSLWTLWHQWSLEFSVTVLEIVFFFHRCCYCHECKLANQMLCFFCFFFFNYFSFLWCSPEAASFTKKTNKTKQKIYIYKIWKQSDLKLVVYLSCFPRTTHSAIALLLFQCCLVRVHLWSIPLSYCKCGQPHVFLPREILCFCILLFEAIKDLWRTVSKTV